MTCLLLLLLRVYCSIECTEREGSAAVDGSSTATTVGINSTTAVCCCTASPLDEPLYICSLDCERREVWDVNIQRKTNIQTKEKEELFAVSINEEAWQEKDDCRHAMHAA